jgi:hypothetical protein
VEAQVLGYKKTILVLFCAMSRIVSEQILLDYVTILRLCDITLDVKIIMNGGQMKMTHLCMLF